jgi:hypothetical protein
MWRPISFTLLFLLLGACARLPPPRAGAARDQEALSRSAELFWRSLRWSDYDTASAVLEEAEPRLGFLERWAATQPVQITDFEIVHIELASEPGDRPEGLVVVKVERIPVGSAVVGVDMIRQTWYRGGELWYLDPESVPYGE